MTREKYKLDVASRLQARGIDIDTSKLLLKQTSPPGDDASRYQVWYDGNDLGEVFKQFVILVHRGRIGQWHFTTKRSCPEEGSRGGRAGGPFERRTDALVAFLVVSLSELFREQWVNKPKAHDTTSSMIIMGEPLSPLLPKRLRKEPIDPFQPRKRRRSR